MMLFNIFDFWIRNQLVIDMYLNMSIGLIDFLF